nr:hypothetical protein [uncultured Arsenicibacter sp.]
MAKQKKGVELTPERRAKYINFLRNLVGYLTSDVPKPVNIGPYAKRYDVVPAVFDALRDLGGLVKDPVRSDEETYYLTRTEMLLKLRPEEIASKLLAQGAATKAGKSVKPDTEEPQTGLVVYQTEWDGMPAIVSGPDPFIITMPDTVPVKTADSVVGETEEEEEPEGVFAQPDYDHSPLPHGVIHEKVSITYGQESDCEDGDRNGQRLQITTVWSPGGGHFTRLSTRRWAFEDISELQQILTDFQQRTQALINP